MPPLAENNHHVDFSGVQSLSCASRISLSSSNSSRSRSSSSSISGNSSSSSRASNRPSILTLETLQNVGAAFRALLLVLERNGVTRASVRDLHHMVSQKQYINAMEQAEVYLDCLLMKELADLDSIILLFVGAWEALFEYSKTAFQQARKDYGKWENQNWVEFIEVQNMAQDQKDRRKRKQLENFRPDQKKELADKLFRATRFKIDCEKRLIQTTEWARYLRAQQRRPQKQ